MSYSRNRNRKLRRRNIALYKQTAWSIKSEKQRDALRRKDNAA